MGSHRPSNARGGTRSARRFVVRRSSGSAHRGFTMIEFLVSIGVVLVLLGLILPAIGSSMERARTTADLATIRSNTATISAFTLANNDLYPLGGASRCAICRGWVRPLLAQGFLSEIAQADPNYRRWEKLSFWMSQSLGAEVREFTRGTTRPCPESPSSAVAVSAVTFPSAKGLMVRAFSEHGGTPMDGEGTQTRFYGRPGEPRWFCCAGIGWDTAVSFCDGSAEIGRYTDYTPDGGRPVQLADHWVGDPIISPWGGYRARER